MKMTFAGKIRTALLLACICQVTTAGGYEYDINDFAIEVVNYIEGTGVGAGYDNPSTALGRPTIETTGDGWYIPVDENVPVVPVYPPFRAFEIVTVGNGGRLTVKFNHPVADDKNNPYGTDFIVFGNAWQSSGQDWTNGNPENTTVGGSVFAEPGIVAVSQDGNDWFYFSNGPHADHFAPTASYNWDEVNDVWTDELDPTKPVDPNLTASDMDGLTLAEMIEAYAGSAGGTGFDIKDLDPNDYAALVIDPNTGQRWIQYIKIEDKAGSSATTEIDAIADVSCCGDYKYPFPDGDINEDCRVNYEDMELLCRYWLACTSDPNDPAVIVDIYEDEDNIINFHDWAVLAEDWLECTWECE